MTRPLVWITRTAPGAQKTARAVEAQGYEALVAPVLKVQPLKTIIDPHGFDAVIVTSGNGLSVFCNLCPRRAITVWCVGDATAEQARKHKFQRVISAGGDADALVDLIRAEADPHDRLLYAAPKAPSADVAGRLCAYGFTVRETAVYETLSVKPALTSATLGRLNTVLIHSARAGAAVAETLNALHDKIAFRNLRFICISEAAWQGAEAELKEVLRQGADVRIPPSPDEAAMLTLLD